jgi:DNA repair photolyase
LSFRGFWNTTEPAEARLQTIRDEVRKLTTNDVVRIGGMTDCFQPIENTKRITYKTIQLLNFFKINYLIVTKSDMVANEEYLKIYNEKLAHFQITITSTSSNEYEKAPAPKRRIEAVEKLQESGFDVSIRLSPFIIQNIDFKILNKIKCNKILIEFLKVNYNVRKWFNINYDDYSLKFGGFEHLELYHKIELVKKIKGFEQVSVGEYVKDHYEYFRDYVNFNKDDCCNLNLYFYPESQLKLSL